MSNNVTIRPLTVISLCDYGEFFSVQSPLPQQASGSCAVQRVDHLLALDNGARKRLSADPTGERKSMESARRASKQKAPRARANDVMNLAVRIGCRVMLQAIQPRRAPFLVVGRECSTCSSKRVIGCGHPGGVFKFRSDAIVSVRIQAMELW